MVNYIVICDLSRPHFINMIFGEKVIECKMSVLIFSTTFFLNIPHSTKNSARYHNFACVYVKFFLSYFNQT